VRSERWEEGRGKREEGRGKREVRSERWEEGRGKREVGWACWERSWKWEVRSEK
jgi:hypothetical protein